MSRARAQPTQSIKTPAPTPINNNNNNTNTNITATTEMDKDKTTETKKKSFTEADLTDAEFRLARKLQQEAGWQPFNKDQYGLHLKRKGANLVTYSIAGAMRGGKSFYHDSRSAHVTLAQLRVHGGYSFGVEQKVEDVVEYWTIDTEELFKEQRSLDDMSTWKDKDNNTAGFRVFLAGFPGHGTQGVTIGDPLTARTRNERALKEGIMESDHWKKFALIIRLDHARPEPTTVRFFYRRTSSGKIETWLPCITIPPGLRDGMSGFFAPRDWIRENKGPWPDNEFPKDRTIHLISAGGLGYYLLPLWGTRRWFFEDEQEEKEKYRQAAQPKQVETVFPVTTEEDTSTVSISEVETDE